MATVLVTGASSGIGRELARSFARRGHDLVLTARREEALRELATDLHEAHGAAAQVVPADLAAADGPESLVNAIRAQALTVDVLVNNAGFATYGRFDRTPLDEELDSLRVNVLALTWLSKALLPDMVRRGHGGLLNVASTAAFQPGPRMATYYASKAYVLHLSEALSEELRDTGVTVTALCPGPTESEFQDRAGMQSSRLVRRGEPFVHDATRVAEAGVRAFERGQRIYVPGHLNRLTAALPRLVPRSWTAWGVGRVNAPDEDDARS